MVNKVKIHPPVKKGKETMIEENREKYTVRKMKRKWEEKRRGRKKREMDRSLL